MELNISAQSVTHVKFLASTPRQSMRRIVGYLEPEMYEEIVEVARMEDLELSAAIRELLSISLRYYRFKKGALNSQSPDNDKLFYCQVCGKQSKLRYLHIASVLNEEYKFCEDCFFADKYKSFVKVQIDRM